MKQNVNKSQSKLLKKANKHLVWGTILKIVFPGTGIGEVLTTTAWIEAMADTYWHRDYWNELLGNDTYKRLAGVEEIPTDYTVSEEDLEKFTEYMKKKLEDKSFVERVKKRLDGMEGESQ